MTELFFTLQELYMTTEAAKLLKIIGDFERIADHGVNLLESAEEMLNKSVKFTRTADSEIGIISSAVREILDLSLTAFLSRTSARKKRIFSHRTQLYGRERAEKNAVKEYGTSRKGK